MEEQEREYLKENMARLEQWEQTPAAPSGRCSDMTEVEKEKLIDLLFDRNEKMSADLSAMTGSLERMSEELRLSREASDRFEKRAIDVEKRAEMERSALQQRIDHLLKLVEKLQNGEALKEALARIAKLEKELKDAKAGSRSFRGQMYGSKSQKSRDGKDDRNDNDRDAGQEKEEMGGKDSVRKLPESGNNADGDDTDPWTEDKYRSKRIFREGKKHRTMNADRRCKHRSDKKSIPAGWVILGEESRFAYEKRTVIIEHEYTYLIVVDPEGRKHVFYCPEGEPEWTVVCDGEEKPSEPLVPNQKPLLDSDGNPVIDCFPHTSATSGMMAEIAIDHFVNKNTYYNMALGFRDYGMSVSRQTLINWMEAGGRVLGKLIPMLLDIAVERDSVVNCDETWCKVRYSGRYTKKYIWCLVNKELKIVIYVYKEGARSRDALMSILGDRSPKAIQSDGYNVYLYLDDELIETEHLCCMAHARAKFHYAWEANREPDAKYILDILRELYHLESLYEKLGLSPEEIKKNRNSEKVTDLVIRLRSKIDAMKSTDHPPKSEMLEKALHYMDDFWTQLFAYRNDGRYSIDNTLAERFMRPVAGERKNSLFYGSDKMAGIASVYRTLISTCRLMKVSVTEYFHKVFRMIVAGCEDLTKLLPQNMGLAVIKN